MDNSRPFLELCVFSTDRIPFAAEEMQEVYALTKEYYKKRDELKALRADIADLEERVNTRASRLVTLNDKCKQLAARE